MGTGCQLACLFASWEQGQITLANTLLFFKNYSLSLISLLSGSVKLKHNEENHRLLQASGSTWTHHSIHPHQTYYCCTSVQISLHLSVSATLPTRTQHKDSHKESCKHLGRPRQAKHKQTNLCLPPVCAALIPFQPCESANLPGEHNTLFGRDTHILAQLTCQFHPSGQNWWNPWRGKQNMELEKPLQGGANQQPLSGK
jgi:hypothetical protein